MPKTRLRQTKKNIDMEYSGVEWALQCALWALKNGRKKEAFEILDELIETRLMEEWSNDDKKTAPKDGKEIGGYNE
jgi:hypothetical protein